MDLAVQAGQTLESTVHAHAAYDSAYQNNIPSQESFPGAGNGDVGTMIGANNEFVTTPNGSLIEYDTAGGFRTIGTDLPSDSSDPSRLNTNGVGFSWFGLFDDDVK